MASGGEEDKINKQNGVLTAASCLFHFWGSRFALDVGQKFAFYQNATEKKIENGREARQFYFYL